MPRHRTRTALAVVSAAACLALATGTASALSADGFDYTVVGDSATITQCTTGTCPAGTLTIPATLNGHPITAIAPSAFEAESSITGLAIGRNVTTIGAKAFFAADALTGVMIPDNVSALGTEAFADCTAMATLSIGSGLTAIPDSAFQNVERLTTLELGENVVSIGDYAFKDASGNGPGLTAITIPASVETIGLEAFKGLGVLDRLTFAEPSHLTTIGEGAFIDAGWLSGTISTVTIPASVTTIGYDAFGDSPTLTSAYFLGNWPGQGNSEYDDVSPFTGSTEATVYRFAGTLGWDPDNTGTYSGQPLMFTPFAAQPATPTAVAGVGSAVVTAGAAPIGPTPTSLTITSTPEGRTCTITGTSGSCTVPGLTDGVPYTFTAVAHLVGQIDSTASFASTAVTPTGSVAPATATATPAAAAEAPAPELRLASSRTTATAIITTFAATGPGTITQIGTTSSGRKLGRATGLTACSVSTTTQQAGTVTLVCPLTNAAKRARLKQRLRVTLTTTYTPTGQAARRTTTTITLNRTTTPTPKPAAGPSAVTG